jgi:hypothetical protein
MVHFKQNDPQAVDVTLRTQKKQFMCKMSCV